MEMNSYIIPPPFDTRQCIKILPPDSMHDQCRRCGCNTSQQDLEQAKRLCSELANPTEGDWAVTMKRIILLRVCKNSHRSKLNSVGQAEILASLIDAYKEVHEETENPIPQVTQRNEELFERYDPTNGRNTVGYILPQAINERQHKQGPVYIFDWPRAPGFLKIGYARASAHARADALARVNTWQLCHPEATCLFKKEFAFPERMEMLIHAELVAKRYRLREGCSRCGRRHTEWFSVTPEQAKRVVCDWSKIAGSPLYLEDRTLCPKWARIIDSLSQVTASTLLPYLEQDPSDEGQRARLVTDQKQTLPLIASDQKGDAVTTVTSAIHNQEDTQIDGLVAKLDRALTVSSETRQIGTE